MSDGTYKVVLTFAPDSRDDHRPWAADSFALIENPGYAGKAPRVLKADCHDGSPFITIQCSCGYQLHQHESRVASIPRDAEIASRCLGCGELLVFPPGFFAEAFQQLRDEGWIE